MYEVQDYYFRKAKEECYPARSVYKLKEIDKRFKIFHENDFVLDLGASPGSWSQYASEKIGSKGRILGIDIRDITLKLENAIFIQSDIRNENLDSIILAMGFNQFNIVLSDLAPNTTGIKITDQSRSYELGLVALDIAPRCLHKQGIFVCKLFDSQDRETFNSQLKRYFENICIFRPKAIRTHSKELYFIGKDLKK